jgi:hypothetical protein
MNLRLISLLGVCDQHLPVKTPSRNRHSDFRQAQSTSITLLRRMEESAERVATS